MSNKDQIVTALVNSYWAEVETIINYISNSVNLDGVRAEEIKKSLSAEVLDELRFEYRYLDLRNLRLQKNFKLRSQAGLKVRNFMDNHGFG